MKKLLSVLIVLVLLLSLVGCNTEPDVAPTGNQSGNSGSQTNPSSGSGASSGSTDQPGDKTGPDQQTTPGGSTDQTPGGSQGTQPEDNQGTTPGGSQEDNQGSQTGGETVEGRMNPLTGEKAAEDVSAQKPYAVILDNAPQALPQSGLSAADVIYEVPVEGGLTRLVAIFQQLDQITEIGAVRSARDYIVEIAAAYDAVLVTAGGSPGAYSAFISSGISLADGTNGRDADTAFFHDPVRRASAGEEHSLMLMPSQLRDYLTQHGQSLVRRASFRAPFTFAPNSAERVGDPATQIEVAFSGGKTTQFAYDADTDSYSVTQYDAAMTDAFNGQAVTVRNVIVLLTSVTALPGDTEGRLAVATMGRGSGVFCCGGKYTVISWSRTAGGAFTYTLSDGSPLNLGIGATYVCVISEAGSVNVQ